MSKINPPNYILNLTREQIIVLFGLVIVASLTSAALYKITEQQEQRSMDLKFQLQTNEIANQIEDEIEINLESLISLNALYSVTGPVSRQSFNSFTSHLLARHGSIQALSWIPGVSFREKIQYESDAQADGFNDFRIYELSEDGGKPVEERELYYPVFYIEPFEGNEVALGFDLASNPVRLAAINKAQSRDQLISTDRITLVQEKATQKAILVFLAFKQTGVLKGFFTGVIRIEDLIRSAVGDQAENLCNITVYDRSAEEGNQLMAQLLSEDIPRLDDNAVFAPPEHLHSANSIRVADREWLIICTPTTNYLTSQARHTAVLLLALSLAFFTGVFYYLYKNYTVVNTAKRTSIILAKQNKELEQFTYVAAHHLQEPLGVVNNFVDQINTKYNGSLDSQADKYLGHISNAASHMSRLVKGLLEYSLIGSTSEKKQVDLAQLVNEIKAEITGSDENECQISAGQLPSVRGNERELKILFENLIHNALKFARPDTVTRIEIDAKREKYYWVFNVRDNGRGMAEIHQERIFELFQQLDVKDKLTGIGAGLAYCRKIVEAHGGHITVESQPGAGSIFTFTLPV
jgi:signal transduction histidine kinase